MNFKRSIMLLILILFIGVVSINTVYAEGNIDNNAKTLDETVLNDKLSNIKFIDEKAIVMGSIADNLIVSNLLVNVSSEFRDEYNIDSINVMDGEEILALDEIVVSDMVLLITLNDSTTYSYVIKVVGDLNNDGIVNDDDVNVMIDGILTPKSEEETSQDEEALEENKEEQIINDVNEDSNVDVLDVTQTTYSINKGNWGIGQVELEDIVSSLDAPDVVYVDDIKDFSETSKMIKELPNVETVKDGEGVVEQVVGAFDIIEKVTIGLVVALILVTAFLISNTIKLTIYSRKFAIKLPFVIEGLIIGLIGSIIPVCITIYGYTILYSVMNGQIFSEMLNMIKPFNFVFHISAVLVLIGILVGMFGSSSEVKRYLKIW